MKAYPVAESLFKESTMPTLPRKETIKLEYLRGHMPQEKDAAFWAAHTELNENGQTKPIPVSKLTDTVFEIIEKDDAKYLLAAFTLQWEYLECLIVNG